MCASICSFTVPGELNLHGDHEEWISRFFSLMKAKVERSNTWKSLKLDVTSHICQSVVLQFVKMIAFDKDMKFMNLQLGMKEACK